MRKRLIFLISVFLLTGIFSVFPHYALASLSVSLSAPSSVDTSYDSSSGTYKADATLTASASGGSTPYRYQFDCGNGTISSNPGANTFGCTYSIPGDSPVDYNASVTVTDNSGTIASDNATITVNPPSGNIIFRPPGRIKTLSEIVNEVLDYIFWIAIVLTPLLIIIAAFYFIFSGGSRERIATAKRIIFYAIIGFIVALLSKAIIGIIRSIFGG